MSSRSLIVYCQQVARDCLIVSLFIHERCVRSDSHNHLVFRADAYQCHGALCSRSTRPLDVWRQRTSTYCRTHQDPNFASDRTIKVHEYTISHRSTIHRNRQLRMEKVRSLRTLKNLITSSLSTRCIQSVNNATVLFLFIPLHSRNVFLCTSFPLFQQTNNTSKFAIPISNEKGPTTSRLPSGLLSSNIQTQSVLYRISSQQLVDIQWDLNDKMTQTRTICPCAYIRVYVYPFTKVAVAPSEPHWFFRRYCIWIFESNLFNPF